VAMRKSSEALFHVPRQLVKVLDRDLAVAGIAKKDSRGRTLDVHAMRHTFGTLLSAGGVAPRTAQAAMRHSRIDLTMNVYTDPKLLDVDGAIQSLPALPLDTNPASDREVIAATGTDNPRPKCVAPTVAPTSGHRGHLVSISGNTGKLGRVAENAPAETENAKSPGKRGVFGAYQKRGRRDSNPQPPDRQSGALTN
jgi:hypothetical protein